MDLDPIPPIQPIGEESKRKKNGGERENKDSRIQGLTLEKLSQESLKSGLLFSSTAAYIMLYLFKIATLEHKQRYFWNKKKPTSRR